MPRKAGTMLTDAGLRKLKRAEPGKRYERFDAGQPGLALRVGDGGTKTWCTYFFFPPPGVSEKRRHVRMTLGNFPAIGVAEARRRASDIKEQAKAGVDPRLAVEAGRLAAREAAQAEVERFRTFGVIAEEYIKRGLRDLADRTRREIPAVIRKRLLPIWGDRPIASLTLRDANRLFDGLIEDGSPMAALNTYKLIKRIGRWAEEVGEIENSPFAKLKPPGEYRARDRILDHDEIRAVWEAAGAAGFPFGPFVRLLLVTGARRNEVAQMRRGDVDMGKGEWLLPATGTKSAREHLLPLPTVALDIIASLPEFTRGEYLFTTTSGRRPICGFSAIKSRLDELSGVSDWRLHDLRRTARSEWARIGTAETVSELLLNHGPKGIAGVYNRYKYYDEKKAGMERWAAALRDVVEPPPDNVTALPAREAG